MLEECSYTTNWFGVNPNNLAAGTYNVSVTDVQGSSGSTTYTINEPLQLIITSTYSGNQLEGYKWRNSHTRMNGF